MREIGRGHTSLTTFCGYMNIPPLMNKNAFNDLQEKLHNVYQEAAMVSMESAAEMVLEI